MTTTERLDTLERRSSHLERRVSRYRGQRTSDSLHVCALPPREQVWDVDTSVSPG